MVQDMVKSGVERNPQIYSKLTLLYLPYVLEKYDPALLQIRPNMGLDGFP